MSDTMSLMLVIVSDLHLTDNGFSGTVPAAAFRIFRERLRDMAYDASWRSDGRYRPVETLHLVLLGDVLDLIRSELWPCVSPADPAYVRPWSAPESTAFQNTICDITESILAKNAESLEVLRSLTSDKIMTLPPATADGKPAHVGREPNAADRVPVQVRIHYLVGNHDWFLHLPGAAYDGVRQRIVSSMCLANPAGRPFPYDPDEDAELAEVSDRHRAWFRHGDIYDPLNFEQQRDRASIGDAIVIDLVNRFGVAVRAELGNELPRECLDGLRQIDYVRPLLVVPIWVNGLLRRTCPDPGAAKKVKAVWDRIVDEFLDLAYVRERGPFLPPHTLDKLELALKFSRGVSLNILSQLFSWFRGRIPGNDRPTYQDALAELAFKNRRARSVIYGHTHHHEIVPLDVSYSSDGILNQVYANTGTWRVVHEQALQKPEAEEFMSHWVMTYVGIYEGDERGGRPFEAWSGALAMPRG